MGQANKLSDDQLSDQPKEQPKEMHSEMHLVFCELCSVPTPTPHSFYS